MAAATRDSRLLYMLKTDKFAKMFYQGFSLTGIQSGTFFSDANQIDAKREKRFKMGWIPNNGLH